MWRDFCGFDENKQRIYACQTAELWYLCAENRLDMTKKRILFGLFAVVVLPICSNRAQCQNIETVVRCVNSAFEKTNSAYYEARITVSDDKDTNFFTQKVGFRKTNRRKRLPKFNIEHSNGVSVEYNMLYDQKHFTLVDHSSGIADQYRREDYKTFVKKVRTELLHPHMLPFKPFNLRDKHTKYSLLSDTLAFDVPCHRIKTLKRGKDEAGEYIREDIWLIDTLESLPLERKTKIERINPPPRSSKRTYCTIEYLRFDRNAAFEDENFAFQAEESPYYLRHMSIAALKEQWHEQETAQSTFAYGTPARHFSLTNSRNEVINTESLNGKVVILAFFYSNCYPCMPMLQDLERIYRIHSEKGLEILAINPVDGEKGVLELDNFKKENSLSYNVCTARRKTVEQTYLVYSYPTIFVIDRKGRIAFSHQGYNALFFSEVEKAVRKYVK